MSQPLCFVLMPFGKKPNGLGGEIDFDAVYRDLIWPAVVEANLEPIQADEEMTGGVIHKPMFERLILCEYAVADLTTANPNVFYELGLRHAVRKATTVLLFAEGGRLPFDVGPLRALPYRLTSDGVPANLAADKPALIRRLAEARSAARTSPPIDSPLYQLVQDYPNVQHEKTDVFRERVAYSAKRKEELAQIRAGSVPLPEKVQALRQLEQALGLPEAVESAVLIDLMLSYRAMKAWGDVIRLVFHMPEVLRRTVMIQEQLALALNRDGRSDEAERVLKQLMAERGPSSETYGILGRVYKDRWEAALRAGNPFLAAGFLEEAIEAYRKGFEADWRDAYPGINAVILMELKDPPDPRRAQLIPVITYAVDRRIDSGKPDYWDYATRLELAVLAKDQAAAATALGRALALVREPWEPETTARSLCLMREARERRSEAVLPWAVAVEQALLSRSAP